MTDDGARGGDDEPDWSFGYGIETSNAVFVGAVFALVGASFLGVGALFAALGDRAVGLALLGAGLLFGGLGIAIARLL
ncbi:MAG: hypothetical protein ABEJ31_04765 [Haloarculaceae archaeon]